MKTSLALLLALCGTLSSGENRADDTWPPLDYLRHDYRAVKVVAHVDVHAAAVVSRIGGYENWKLSCLVLEPLKGSVKRGDVLEYYLGAEAGFSRERFLGQKIIFLLSEYDSSLKAKVYITLENSTLPHTPGLLAKLRTIRASQH